MTSHSSTKRRWQRLVATTFGLIYPVFLAGTWLLLRLSHDTYWPLVVALYAPPIGFLLPAPIVLLLTWRWGSRWLVALQGASVALALFTLLGLRLGLGRNGRMADEPHAIHLLSYNIQLGRRGIAGVAAQVAGLHPNVVLLQEAQSDLAAQLSRTFVGWHVDHRDQFFLASRYPILDVRPPQPLHYSAGEGGGISDRDGGARFMAYTLATDFGPVDVFSIHTTSPREGLESMRGQGFGYELRHGRVLFGKDARALLFNVYRRHRQIKAVAEQALASARPAIVAGDFNSPGLSREPYDSLRGFTDAFDRAGIGFGYTYPSKLPFLRIDRIFVGNGLRAVKFQVGDTQASDHLCVKATIVLERSPGR
jgi:vancomycin resistance protein VanJ